MRLPDRHFKVIMKYMKLLDFDYDDQILVIQSQTKTKWATFNWTIGDSDSLHCEELAVGDEWEYEPTKEQLDKVWEFCLQCEKYVEESKQEADDWEETKDHLNYWLNHNVL